jgi:hypothetical protein
MPTAAQSASTKSRYADTSKRIVGIHEKVASGSRQATQNYLDGYENAVGRVSDAYTKVAARTGVKWISDIAEAQADLTKGIVKAYTGAAR